MKTAQKTGLFLASAVSFLVATDAFAMNNQATPTYKEVKVAENTDGVWNKTKDVTSDVWEGTKDVASDVWDGTKNVASDVWDGTKEVGSDIKDGVMGSDEKKAQNKTVTTD